MDRIYFQWHITNLCNYRCLHCYQDNFTAEDDLDWAGLKKVADCIIQTAKKKNCKIRINLTGGEPFLKKEFFILLNYLQESPVIETLSIITNGSLINLKIIEELKKYKKIKEIKISLEGASASLNDSIRAKGSYQKVWDAIHLLKKETSFPIIIMFTVLKSNLSDLPLLLQKAKEEKICGIIIERFFPLGQGKKINFETLHISDWYKLNKMILALDNFSFNLNDLLPYRAFWIKFISAKIKVFAALCNVSKNSFCIMPNADVYPCRRFVLKLGNLLKESLSKIMESPLLKEILDYPKKGLCKDCDILGCKGCPAISYLLRNDWQAEDPQCWYRKELESLSFNL